MLMPRLAVGEEHALYVSMCKVIDSPGLAFLAEKTRSPLPREFARISYDIKLEASSQHSKVYRLPQRVAMIPSFMSIAVCAHKPDDQQKPQRYI